MSRGILTRREFLLLAAMGGAGAVTCGSGTLAAVLLLNREVPPAPAPIPAVVSAAPQIIRRAAWGALPPDHNAPNEHGYYSTTNPEGWRVYEQPLVDVYQTAVLHHSVIDLRDDLTTALDVQRAHREDNGWADIGYHYMIGKNGAIYEGRDLHVRGTHVARYNTGSVGLCLLGDFTYQQPTTIQLEAVQGLLLWLSHTLQLTHLAGHGDFNDGTQCPGVHLRAYLSALAQGAGLALGTEGYIPPAA